MMSRFLVLRRMALQEPGYTLGRLVSHYWSEKERFRNAVAESIVGMVGESFEVEASGWDGRFD